MYVCMYACMYVCCRKINFSLKSNSHKTIKYRSFKSFNENEFLQDLSAVPWSEIELLENVDTMLDVWYDFFNDVIDKHAPIKTHRIKNEVQPEWVTSDIWIKLNKGTILEKKADLMIIE